MANLHKHMANYLPYIHYKYDTEMFTLGLMNIHQLISIPRTIWTWVCSLPNIGDGGPKMPENDPKPPVISKNG